MSDNDDEFFYDKCSSEPNRFNQDDLSDLIRDLNLSKQAAELLASLLKERNFLKPKTEVTFFLILYNLLNKGKISKV